MAAIAVLKGPSVTQVQAAAGRLRAATDEMRCMVREADGPVLAEALIQVRESGVDPLEAVFAEGLRRFDQSGEYAADGAIGIVAWLRSNCRLSGGAAAERVAISRQLEHLPETQKAFAGGDLGYQHVAIMARTAEHVGVAAVRKQETQLLKAAVTTDPGQFAGVAKDFEHRVDAGAVLAEANRAYERRYLHIGEPLDGIVRIDGLVDTEAGAIIRNAVSALTLPARDDDRTPGQRRADALVDVCRYGPGRKGFDGKGAHAADGAGPRPQLVIRASVETLTRTAGAPAGELESAGAIPAEAVRRHACDAAITRILGSGELEHEIGHASRAIPPATRRALAARDHHCVFNRCDRPPVWCDGHHLVHWADAGQPGWRISPSCVGHTIAWSTKRAGASSDMPDGSSRGHRVLGWCRNASARSPRCVHELGDSRAARRCFPLGPPFGPRLGPDRNDRQRDSNNGGENPHSGDEPGTAGREGEATDSGANAKECADRKVGNSYRKDDKPTDVFAVSCIGSETNGKEHQSEHQGCETPDDGQRAHGEAQPPGRAHQLGCHCLARR
jgi:Domain of unknown function (DUF222)